MKPTTLTLWLSLALASQASWFGSSHPDPPYKTWSSTQLAAWLEAHNIPTPDTVNAELKDLVQQHWDTASAWSYDQYTTAQKAFGDVHDTAFEKWDESHLREFLLKQGIVSPKSKKEELVKLANSQYHSFTNAASAFAAPTRTTFPAYHHATQSVSSAAARVTETVVRTLDDTKDYVYSTWDDNRLRAYLESKGIQVKAQAHKTRSDLLAMMYEAYAKVTDPVWKAWSDSYIHEWLVAHHIIAPQPPEPYTREYLLQKMSEYYYDANDKVYSTWTESQLKEWLVKNGYVKSDAQIKREKLQKLVEDNFLSAKSTAVDAWSDSQIREWLIEHKYIDNRTATQKKRDDLIEMFKEKYHATTATPYLAWPDARLRAYLRQHGLPEDQLPTGRPGLLQEVRIRWVQAQTLWDKVREIVLGVELSVEDRLSRLWAILRGESHMYENAKRTASNTYENAAEEAEGQYERAKSAANEKYGEAKAAAEGTYRKAADAAYGKYEETKRSTSGQYEQAKGKAQEKYGNAEKEAARQYNEAEKAYEAGKERAYEKGQEAKVGAGQKVKEGGEYVKRAGEQMQREEL